MKPKIFIFTQPLGDGSGDVLAFAMAQDGVGLAQHLCSSAVYARHDMGLNSRKKHDKYEEYYPDGYDLIDYTEATDELLQLDPLFMVAYVRNHRSFEKDKANGEDTAGTAGVQSADT